MKSQWMIYGANGYSAQLAIEKALKLGKAPILAGRNQAAIAALGKNLSDEMTLLTSADVPTQTGSYMGIYEEPRTWALDVRYRY